LDDDTSSAPDDLGKRPDLFDAGAGMTNRLKAGATVPIKDRVAVLEALNTVARLQEVDPAAIAAMINTESRWITYCVTGKYMGLTQVGPEILKALDLTREQFLNLSAHDQIYAYGSWLDHYEFSKKMASKKIDVAAMPLARQASVLQAMQFSPNGKAWMTALSNGDLSVRSTKFKQAAFLGDTSIAAMGRYYAAFFKRFPPAYA
jgi:hypothetical protein